MGDTETAKKPAATNEAPPVTDGAAPKTADPKAAGGKATNLQVRANYENIPGSSKTGPKIAKEETALWFDPLTIAPTSPSAPETIDINGISHGGSQVVANHSVPLHGADEDGAGEGTGTLTAQLKYAEQWEKSFVPKVTGKWAKKGDEKKAEGILKTFLADKLKHTGDLESVSSQAAAKIQGEVDGSSDVKVSITPNETNKSLADAGKTHVYYKARKNPGILLDVPVVQVAEKVVTSGGSTTKTQGSEVSGEASGSTTTNTVKVDETKTNNKAAGSSTTTETSEDYHAATQRTYQEIVTKIEKTISDFASNLVKKPDTDEKFHEEGKWEYWNENIKVDDYTKNVKAGSKEGDKEEKNWAEYLKEGLGVVNEIIDIPILKDIPKVGKYFRKLNEWGWVLDGLEKGAGVFAVKGKVHYIDTHEDTTVKDTKTDNTKGGGNDSKDVTKHTTTNATEELKQHMTKTVSSRKEKMGFDNTTTDVKKNAKSTTNSGSASSEVATDNYNKTDTTNTASGSVKAKANQSTTAEITWSQSVKETTTLCSGDAKHCDEVKP